MDAKASDNSIFNVITTIYIFRLFTKMVLPKLYYIPRKNNYYIFDIGSFCGACYIYNGRLGEMVGGNAHIIFFSIIIFNIQTI